MNEYHEKTSPMIFRKIGSPMTIPEIGSPMDEMTPPMGIRERPSDDDPSDEKGPPMSSVDKPSDELVEKSPPMTIRERPSDENVREAVTQLLELTACRCLPDWIDRGLHERECLEHYRADVVVLVAAAGWTAPGARVRKRYACATEGTRNA